MNSINTPGFPGGQPQVTAADARVTNSKNDNGRLDRRENHVSAVQANNSIASTSSSRNRPSAASRQSKHIDAHPRPVLKITVSPAAVTNIPELMRSQKQWVVWRNLWNQKREEWAKVPSTPGSKKPARTTDPISWRTFDDAMKAFQKGNVDGLGFVFAQDSLVGIDLDACRDPETGEVADWARDIIHRYPTYWEITPSGSGFHGFFRLDRPFNPKPNKFFGMAKFLSTSEKKPQIEIYTNKRYFTVTGEAVVFENGELTSGLAPLASYPDSLHKDLVNAYDRTKNGANGQQSKSDGSGELQAIANDQSAIDQSAFTKVALMMPANTTPEELEAEIRRRAQNEMLPRVPVTGGGVVKVHYRQKWDEVRGNGTWLLHSCTHALQFADQIRSERSRASGKVNLAVPRHPLTDLGNAERFVGDYSTQVRYSYLNRQWYYWDQKRWQADHSGIIRRYAHATVRRVRDEALDANDEKLILAILRHQHRSESYARVEAMIHSAEPLLAIDLESLDSHSMLFNCQNCTIDLETGASLPHHPEHLLTKLSPVTYDPSADYPKFRQFLEQITVGDKELEDFLQRVAGLILTGKTVAKIFMLYGIGANGKSTLLEIWRYILGEYADNIDPKSLMSFREQRIRTDIAKLKGARFVTTTESENGDLLSEGLVKSLTGGDKVTARFLYKDEFSYYPQFKLLLATNYLPHVRGTDQGLWRRLVVIPFAATFGPDDQIPDLADKLKAEASGILNWMLEGLLKFLTSGLPEPTVVKEATEQYRKEKDLLAQFVDSCCELGPSAKVGSRDLYNVFEQWFRTKWRTPDDCAGVPCSASSKRI